MTLALLFARLSVCLHVVCAAPWLAAAGHVRGNQDEPSAVVADGQHLAIIDNDTSPKREADSRELLVSVCKVMSYSRVSLGTPYCHGLEEVGGKCYNRCPYEYPSILYQRIGTDCRQMCAGSKWRETGPTTCENLEQTFVREPYRGTISACDRAYPGRGCQLLDNGRVYVKCPKGYNTQYTKCIPVIDCIARGYNSSSTVPAGTCVKRIIKGEPGSRASCPTGAENPYDPMCYAPCNPGYEAVGDTKCITPIPPGFYDCGNGFAAQRASQCSNIPSFVPSCGLWPSSALISGITCSCERPFTSRRYSCTDGTSTTCSTGACVATTPWVKNNSNTNFCGANYCSCDTPNTGTIGRNRFTCTDGLVGTCTSTEACAATTPWLKSSASPARYCGVTCACDTPNTGSVGRNRFTCTDGYAAYCTSVSACTATTPWFRYSDTKFCAVTCKCDTPNAGTAGHNRFSCTDGYAAYCTSVSPCVATTPWVKGSNTTFCGVTCSCDTPNSGTVGRNRFTCSDGTAAYCTSTKACVRTTPWLKGSNTNFCG